MVAGFYWWPGKDSETLIIDLQIIKSKLIKKRRKDFQKKLIPLKEF
jgi:hypothetical protein